MTLPVQQIVYQFTTDGTQTTWPVNFSVLGSENVAAYLDGVLLTQGTDYEVIVDGSGNRTVQRIGSAWSSGSELTIRPITAIEQLLDLVQYSRFDAEAIETAIDRLTHITRELSETQGRALVESLFESVVDARGNRIINVGEPTGDMDAVNRAYVLSYFATLPPGPEGPPGPAIPGPGGLPGPSGISLPQLSGSGAPDPLDGLDSQTYLNVDNGDLYQKVNGAWTLLTNLRGPQGLPGSGGGGGGVTDHGALTGLNDADHPITAVAGLRSELDTILANLVTLAGLDVDVFRQDNPPAAPIVAGSLWFDTNDGNRLYRWDGTQWIDQSDARLDTLAAGLAQAIQDAATAQATADGGIEIFYADADFPPTANGVGDYWYLTDTGLSARWDGTQWVMLAPNSQIAIALASAQNAQATADGRIYAFFQPTPPTAASTPTPVVGDLWFDTDAGNHEYRYNGTTWVSVRDAGIAAAAAQAALAIQQITAVSSQLDGVIEIYYQADPPDGSSNPPPSEGDQWIDTDDNQVYRYTSNVWVSVRDTGLAQAITDSATAIGLADQKVRVFLQNSAPTLITNPELDTGDLWIDLDGNNRVYRWTGSAWQDVTTTIGGGDILPNAVSEQRSGFASEPTGAQVIADAHTSEGNLITIIGTVELSVFGATNFGLGTDFSLRLRRRPVGGAFTDLQTFTLPPTNNTDGVRDGDIYASILAPVRGSANWIVRPVSASTLRFALEFRIYDTPGAGVYEYAIDYLSSTPTGSKTFTTAINTTEIKR